MAYTKYSLTPANNNAAPPDGAPEGMLPSAVNDTMRDMMAQIRDVGDGVRNGTYTMTAPVITGGSINGTAIGASTASTGAFSTLSASGVATFSAGTVSAPAITTTGDTNTGIFFPAADTIAFTEGGVEAMRIDSSANVGIGTSSPTVYGANDKVLQVNSGANGGAIRISNTTTGATGGLLNYQLGLNSYLYNTSAGFLAFGASNAEAMRITSAGNVGIGTSSPASRLHSSGVITSGVSGGADGSYVLKRASDSLSVGDLTIDTTNSLLKLNTAYSFLTFGTEGTERVRINGSGNVGIGTSSPNTTLEVNKNITFANADTFGQLVVKTTAGATGRLLNIGVDEANNISFIQSINRGSAANDLVLQRYGGNVGIGTSSPNDRLDIVGGNIRIASGNVIRFVDSGNVRVSIQGDTSSNAIFSTAGSERMRIDSSGNLLVGATSTGPVNANAITIEPANSRIRIAHASTANATPYIQFDYNGGAIGSITQSTTSSVAYNTSSDYRLKENIAPMTGALDVVQQLKPVTYNWKLDGSNGQGFIAHELQAVVPDCVTGEKDAVDAEGKPQYQGIDTSFLVATLTAALQEAHGLIKDLQARVETLEAK